MNQKVLVTGSSGFIGYHVSKKLIELGFVVLGIDDHNDYYDVNLKIARCKHLLKEREFSFHEINLKNHPLLEKLISSHEPDFIIHLAAQAGVRYSIINPISYIDSNVEGFFNILEASRKFNIKKLIFASSSSVYGNSKDSSFKESEVDLRPASLYGATKLFNEKISKKYSDSFGINIIGLRFFSVYGPFGRPDMAYFLFSKNIKSDKDIIVYNDGEMERDMTYIDDIVSGIILSMNYQNKDSNFELFNLGNNMPIKTKSLLSLIEKSLNKKAKVNYENSINESLSTCANLELSNQKLGYSPKISFEEGMEKFLKWFKEFYEY